MFLKEEGEGGEEKLRERERGFARGRVRRIGGECGRAREQSRAKGKVRRRQLTISIQTSVLEAWGSFAHTLSCASQLQGVCGGELLPIPAPHRPCSLKRDPPPPNIRRSSSPMNRGAKFPTSDLRSHNCRIVGSTLSRPIQAAVLG